MSFQPESFAHSRDARRLLLALKATWRAESLSPGAISALLSARRLRYDGELSEAVQILEESDANDRPDPTGMERNADLGEQNKSVLYELGWCHLLRGSYVEAADVFRTLRQAQRVRIAQKLESASPLANDSAPEAAARESELDMRGSGSRRATSSEIGGLQTSLESGLSADAQDGTINLKSPGRMESCHVDGPWGLFYLSLEAACRWEAGAEQHPAAIKLMKEIVESAAQKSSGYVTRIRLGSRQLDIKLFIDRR
jgi:hypothetical protein